MADHLEIDPDNLRRLAAQHDQAAADIRKWGEIPQGWLETFQLTYGTIADTMRLALVDYYDRRHRKAEAQAARHDKTRDELLAAAKALEEAEQTGAGHVTRAGEFGEAPSRSIAPPGGDRDDEPRSHGNPPNARFTDEGIVPTHTPESAAPISDASYRGGSIPTPIDTVATANAAPSPTMPHWSGGSNRSSDEDVDQIPFAFEGTASREEVDEATRGDGMAPPSSAVPISRGMTEAAPGGVVTPGGPVKVPQPLTKGPLPVSIATAKTRTGLPTLVVGDSDDDDLALARDLLEAVLAAVGDTVPRLEWSSGVVRTPQGPFLLLTSGEGRGWLPPNLYLPPEVIIPWRWPRALRTSYREKAGNLVEREQDPARIITEFVANARRRKLKLTALASSSVVDFDLRERLGYSVKCANRVEAHDNTVDFSSPGDGLVDRLELAGSNRSLRAVESVPDESIREVCVKLAESAYEQVRSSVEGYGRDDDARLGILAALKSGNRAPFELIEKLVVEDFEHTAVTVEPRYAEERASNATRRADILLRRVDELLVLASAEVCNRKSLRDSFYVYDQVVDPSNPPAADGLLHSKQGLVGTSSLDTAPTPKSVPPGNRALTLSGEVSTPVGGYPADPAASEWRQEHRRS